MKEAERFHLKGIPASPGLAVGRVCFWSDPEGIPRYSIKPEEVREELKRLDEALAASKRQIEELHQRVQKELGEEEAAIFSSHNVLLHDPAFYAKVERVLITENINLEAAVEDVLEELIKIFLKIPDPYIRERADDYRDVGRRVLDNLLSRQRQCTAEEGELIVMVARELVPSDTVQFHRQHIGAFVTEHGGIASHAAILARSLRLPAIVSIPKILKKLRAGEMVVVDGNLGRIHVNPSPELIAGARQEMAARNQTLYETLPAKTARTMDKVEITFTANLTREAEAEVAHQMGAVGVGLLRTEFLFMDHQEFLDEEKQYQAYRYVVERMAPYPVTIRTLDLGEDKFFDFENPVNEERLCVLGWRSIRISLAYEKVFLTQLRAILRTSAHGPVRILLPMVTGVEEIRAVRALLAKAEKSLAAEKIVFQAEVPLGAMIETPAAAILPENILQEADFLSVGSNDLVQYMMVADRTSERLQEYYQSTSPAILKVLHHLAQASRIAKKEISICGEIASDPKFLPLLLGLGYRTLSVAPVLLPDLVRRVQQLSLEQCEQIANRCLKARTAAEVEKQLQPEGPITSVSHNN